MRSPQMEINEQKIHEFFGRIQQVSCSIINRMYNHTKINHKFIIDAVEEKHRKTFPRFATKIIYRQILIIRGCWTCSFIYFISSSSHIYGIIEYFFIILLLALYF